MAISESMGIKVTPASQYALKQAKIYGLRLTSGYRSPSHDKQVGGSGSGPHTRGTAYDFAGNYRDMERFAQAMYSSGLFSQVIFKDKDYATGRRISGHQDHVHLGWKADGSSGSVTAPKSENLEEGSEGSLVIAIQSMLATMYKDLKVDGKFGAETEQAVKRFQAQAKLTVDGIVGKNTWKSLTGVFFSR
jgi:murein L,D-transpeptidase YcbB/YkuD